MTAADFIFLCIVVFIVVAGLPFIMVIAGRFFPSIDEETIKQLQCDIEKLEKAIEDHNDYCICGCSCCNTLRDVMGVSWGEPRHER